MTILSEIPNGLVFHRAFHPNPYRICTIWNLTLYSSIQLSRADVISSYPINLLFPDSSSGWTRHIHWFLQKSFMIQRICLQGHQVNSTPPTFICIVISYSPPLRSIEVPEGRASFWETTAWALAKAGRKHYLQLGEPDHGFFVSARWSSVSCVIFFVVLPQCGNDLYLCGCVIWCHWPCTRTYQWPQEFVMGVPTTHIEIIWGFGYRSFGKISLAEK